MWLLTFDPHPSPEMPPPTSRMLHKPPSTVLSPAHLQRFGPYCGVKVKFSLWKLHLPVGIWDFSWVGCNMISSSVPFPWQRQPAATPVSQGGDLHP